MISDESRSVTSRDGVTYPLTVERESPLYGKVITFLYLPDRASHIKTEHYPDTGLYHIAYVNVFRGDDMRNKGLGTELIRVALDDARQQRATRVNAVITHHACRRAMVKVFGEDAVAPHEDNPAIARLNFPIQYE